MKQFVVGFLLYFINIITAIVFCMIDILDAILLNPIRTIIPCLCGKWIEFNFKESMNFKRYSFFDTFEELKDARSANRN